MWLIENFFSWIGMTAVYLALLAGFALYALSKLWRWLPRLALYSFWFEIVGVILLVVGTYFAGKYANELEWQQRGQELEQQLKQAQAQSQQVNTVIEERVVTQTRVVRERAQQVVKYIDREVVKYDTKFVPGGECEIPKEFVSAVNSAAERPAK